jgi:stress-induced-phosphoprotein 1
MLFSSSCQLAANNILRFQAAEDGRQCTNLDAKFLKGYHRAGNALMHLDGTANLKAGVALVEKGLMHFPVNTDLQALLVNVRTRYETMEAKRKSGLTGADALKEEANDLFKAASFEQAIPMYTKALEACTDKSSKLAVSILNNRAACNQQLSNFGSVIDDTTAVLEVDPNNIKALIRRALALEAKERYRVALADIRKVLAINPTVDIANRAQHRLGQAVRQQKASKGL